MWHIIGAVAAAALAIAPVAVAGGWLATSFRRRTTRILAHLDIVEKLKTGQAHDDLRAHVETEVLEHIAALDNATVRRWNRIAVGTAVASIAVGVTLGVLVLLQVLGRGNAATLVWTAAGSILLSLVTSRVVNRAERLMDEAGKSASAAT